LTGHRILAEGPLNPTLNGMAVDADDTIYVTTVTGTRQNPRGLICALPDEREGRCYLAPNGVSPQTITAAGPGVLYALSEETLVKLELPSDERSID
jgi:sugar lactone lactonase YvrE